MQFSPVFFLVPTAPRSTFIRLLRNLRYHPQCPWCIFLPHMNLHKPQLLSTSTTKLVILEQVFNFVSSPDHICLNLAFLGTKCMRQFLILPRLDVIVLSVPAMDVPLNCVTFVTNHENDGVEVIAQHGRYFLGCEL